VILKKPFLKLLDQDEQCETIDVIDDEEIL
jgi:hypothetical protein